VVNPLLCRGFTISGVVAGVYSRVIGTGAPRRSKACRCAGVGGGDLFDLVAADGDGLAGEGGQ
jgi:hypothetical protein